MIMEIRVSHITREFGAFPVGAVQGLVDARLCLPKDGHDTPRGALAALSVFRDVRVVPNQFAGTADIKAAGLDVAH